MKFWTILRGLCVVCGVLEVVSSCSLDSECSRDHLCCERHCTVWENCRDSCGQDTDCNSQRSQICYKHRCIEESLSFNYCINDKDCKDSKSKSNGKCKDNRCITREKTKRNNHDSGEVAWIRALFITGSVVLSLLACVIVYWYRRRCKPSPRPHINMTVIPLHSRLLPTGDEDTDRIVEQPFNQDRI